MYLLHNFNNNFKVVHHKKIFMGQIMHVGIAIFNFSLKKRKAAFLKILILFLIFINSTISVFISHAQPNELLFKKINPENGFSNNLITCITQDQYGYIWFGTAEGLNRYDGYENKIFKKVLNDTTSLVDDHIICFYQDSKNRFWVGTMYGLCNYNFNTETFKNYIPDKTNPNLNTVNWISRIQESVDHELYMITENGVLYLFENDSLKLIRNFWEYGHVKDFLIDSLGIFWIGTIDGILRYDKNNDKVNLITNCYRNNRPTNLGWIYCMKEYGDTIWYGAQSGQFGFMPKKTLRAELIDFTENTVFLIHNFFRDQQGCFYISTGSGLYILDYNYKLIGHYSYHPNNQFGLNNNIASYTYQDNQDNLWVGTAQGANIAMNGKKFNNYNYYSQKIKLELINIQKLLIDSKGNLWMGSYNNGVSVVNLRSGENKLFLPDPSNPFSLGDGSVINIFEDSKDNIWFGTYMGYLQRYEPATKRFIPYTFNNLTNGRVGVKDIRSMAEDKDGNLWLIVHGFGLFKLNPETKEYKYFTNDPSNLKHSLPDNWSYQVQLVDDSILWIATPSGLSRFNIKTERFTNYFYDPKDSTSLSNNHVNLVFSDSENNLWIGTSFGLNYFNTKSNTFTHFYEIDGLPSNQIKSFIEERPGIIWMGTGYGLTRMAYKIDSETGNPDVEFRNYNRTDNLQDVFFWENSATKTKSGELIFGTENGIIAFNPQEIKDNTIPPDIYITEFLLFNRPVNVGDYDSILHTHLRNTSTITLKHDQNTISFKYVAINYISPENNQYAYILQGFDKDWIKAGNKREAIYTNLPPGTYNFIVKASNNDGYWNETGTSIKIIVLSPWWKTIWFKILLYSSMTGLFIMFYYLILLFYRNQQRKLLVLVKDRTSELEEATHILSDQQIKILEQNKELDKHRNKLEQIVEERTRELIEAKNKAEESDRLKSSFLANLSHEIRTPLNAILGFSTLLGEKEIDDSEREHYNMVIKNNSNNLLELISDILDLSKIEAGQLELVLKPVKIDTIVNDMKGIFDALMERQEYKKDHDVKFKIKIEDRLLNTQIITDLLRLEQVVSNLINNAIKFTNKGYIELGCIKLDDIKMLEFYVKDTGIGIKEENISLIFERFRKVEDDKNQLHRGTGLGLAISSQLINLLGGTIYLTSRYGNGTSFYFTIPLIEDYTTIIATKNDVAFGIIPDLSDYGVLIAEDDYSNYMYVKHLLKKTNAKIFHAVNGNDAIKQLQKNKEIKIVLMDIKMPEKDGIETLLELRKMKIQVPIIAQTAYAFANEVMELKSKGFDEYIAKPINPSELYRKIGFLLK
jgi:signal transduction histidine kinase/ligand-binding sensor domain-containing protein